jgi:hypothetical protein
MAVVSGGTTLIDNGALDAGVSTGSLILLSTQTASASASIEFSMDSSYDSYIFKFINIHPQTDFVDFTFNLSTDNGSNYNVTKTSTFFNAYHSENDSFTGLDYNTSFDLAQSTNFQSIFNDVGNGADESVTGYLQLFNPSSDTFVKHYIVNTQGMYADNYSVNSYTAGYGNTTSPITNIKFQMDSGNIDDGIIKMYGVS